MVVACTASAADRDSVNLQYQLKQGDTCWYDVTNHTSIRSAALPTPMVTTVSSAFKIVATNTTEEQIGLDFGYEDMRMAVQGATVMGRADTMMSQPADTALKLTVILDRKGEILLAWPSSALVVAYQSGSRLSGNGVRNSVRNIFLPYSAKAVGVGDTWNTTMIDTTYKAGALLISQSTNTMKFDGITDTLGVQCARILVSSDNVTLSGDSKAASNAMNMRGNGTMAGVYYVALRSGLLLVQTTQSEMDMFMTPAGQTEPAVSMHISSTILVENRQKRQ